MKLSDEAVAALARAIGISAAEIAKRKMFLEFGEADVRLLTELHKRLQDAHAFIPDAGSLDRLKRTQAAYFGSLTAGDYVPEYILHRLRVGPEPKWYIGACSKYLSGLLPELWRLLRRDPQKFLDTYRALQQLVLLDMGARH